MKHNTKHKNSKIRNIFRIDREQYYFLSCTFLSMLSILIMKYQVY